MANARKFRRLNRVLEEKLEKANKSLRTARSTITSKNKEIKQLKADQAAAKSK